jgi:drug/metabolite transporter (DMT)-like permease
MATTTLTSPAAAAPASGNRPLLVVAALGTVYVVWGSTYLALWIMVEQMPPLLASGLRAVAAGVLLATALTVRGGPRRLLVTGPQLAACALMGLLLPVLGQGLVTVAEGGGAPSGLTALLIAAVPLWVACYRTLAGDRPAARTVVGVVVGFAGVAVLVASNGVGGSVPSWTLLTVVAASVAWSLGSWLQPHLHLPRDPFVVVVYEMIVGGAVLTITGLGRGEHFDPAAYTARSWAAWTFLVLVGSILAFSAYAWLLQTTAVSVVVTYAYVSPVVAVFLGWLVLSEPVTVTILLGTVIVVSGVALVVGAERPAAKSAARQSAEVGR